MDLWIRSQNREDLIPQPSLSIEKVEHSVTGKMWYIVNNINLDEAQTLGTYRTKNRALEVLDEIQNILKQKYILDTSSIKPDGDFYEENGVIFQNYNANARIQELSTFVYQMPEK